MVCSITRYSWAHGFNVRIPWLDISLEVKHQEKKWWLVTLVLDDDDTPIHHYLKGKVFRKTTS